VIWCAAPPELWLGPATSERIYRDIEVEDPAVQKSWGAPTGRVADQDHAAKPAVSKIVYEVAAMTRAACCARSRKLEVRTTLHSVVASEAAGR